VRRSSLGSLRVARNDPSDERRTTLATSVALAAALLATSVALAAAAAAARARAFAARNALRPATAAEARNQAIHNKVITATTGIVTLIKTMDAYTLWWVTQWINWRKENVTVSETELRSYRDWVRITGARAAAGMEGTVPQTPE
jgi:hypothetical protein